MTMRFTRAGENGRLTLAVPAKGRMAEPALRLCADAGLSFEVTERSLVVPCAPAVGLRDVVLTGRLPGPGPEGAEATRWYGGRRHAGDVLEGLAPVGDHDRRSVRTDPPPEGQRRPGIEPGAS